MIGLAYYLYLGGAAVPPARGRGRACSTSASWPARLAVVTMLAVTVALSVAPSLALGLTERSVVGITILRAVSPGVRW